MGFNIGAIEDRSEDRSEDRDPASAASGAMARARTMTDIVWKEVLRMRHL